MTAILTICLLTGAWVALAQAVYRAPSRLSLPLGLLAAALLLLAHTNPIVVLPAAVTAVAAGLRFRKRDAAAKHRLDAAAGRRFL